MKHLFLVAILLSLMSLHINAAIYTVTNLNDSGPGSLRAAVAAATSTSATDAITFTISGCPNNICRIVLISGALVITSGSSSGALSISNPSGAASLIISGNNASQVFITSGSNAITFDGLTLENGAGDYGGAIYNAGNLTISNSVIRNNLAVFGGGIGNRGISFGTEPQYGTLVVTRTEITGNVASSDQNQSFGGGIYADDMSFMLIRDSTIAGNSAQYGGGIGLDSYKYGPWTTVIANSTISGNASGNGIYASAGFLRTINSTITMNSGGGVAMFTATLSTRNSVIAGNTSFDIYNHFGTHINLGNNLIGGSPMLAPLASNGGPTRTHSLLAGSPAIDTGNNCVLVANGCGDGNLALPADQRGVTRVGAVDIGAFELAASASQHQLSGRVTTLAGRGVPRGRVTLDDGAGNVRVAITNPFGYFRFENVAAGTYTASVKSKSYTFTPRVVSVSSSITDLDFVALEIP